MIRFGPAGNGDSFYQAGYKSSLDIPKYINAVGLNAYEYQCGRGVNIKVKFCRQLAAQAEEYGIALSLHAPYFINPGTSDPAVVESSLRHLARSLEAAAAMGASRIVVHPGSVGGGLRCEALARAQAFFVRVVEELMVSYPGISLCLETMGKINQLGALEEVIRFCLLADCYQPAIDFGHLHARGQGAIRAREDYEEILQLLDHALGAQAVQNLHIHFSSIEYGQGGELRHRTFAEGEYGPDFQPLAALIARDGLTPVIISESAGQQTEDALAMKEMVEKCRAREEEVNV